MSEDLNSQFKEELHSQITHYANSDTVQVAIRVH